MREMKKILIFFLLISLCGGSSAVIEETKAVEESSTTISTSTTTTLFSPKFPEDFYTADEIVVFTDEFDKQLYEKYFVEKFLDNSTANEYKFYEVAYGYDDCKEVFFEAFEEKADSVEEQNLLTEEYCTRTVVIETEKVFTYPLMRSEVNNSCKEDFNSYMNEFILSYIGNETGERGWFTEISWVAKTEFVGIGLNNQDLHYVSFLIDIFPAGGGAYVFHDWYEINYDFENCSIIKFEEIITVPTNHLEIFPNLNNYTYEINESTLVAHILDLGVCGDQNLFCKSFYQSQLNPGEYKSYSLSFMFNKKGIIVDIGNYFIHRTPNYRFIPWEELDQIVSKQLNRYINN